jgi:preprotein translocase subunit Sec61beta
MSNDNKVQMPSSGAGLTRYFDDSHSKIELKPEHVVAFIIFVMIILVILNWQGYTWFGLR